MSDAKAPVWPGPRAVVPMTVDALVVGVPDVGGSRWARTQFSYETLLSGGSGEPPPLTPATPGQAPQPGVHVLWTLPHALRSGAQLTEGDDHGSVEFPLVPNRFLIGRYEYAPFSGSVVPTVAPPKMIAWVLESDALSPLEEDGQVSQYPNPAADPGNISVKALGRAVEIGRWDGPGAPTTPFLRAVGPGAVSWSVGYDNVRNVFSIHDASLAEDARPTDPYRYTYCVFGWYAAPGDDLLADLPTDSITDWMAALSAFQWSAGASTGDVAEAEADWEAWRQSRGIDGGPTDPELPPQTQAWIEGWRRWQAAHGEPGPKPSLPTQVLLYGWVTNVQWGGKDKAYGSGAPGGGKPAEAVAVGNTPTESISAWIAKLVFDQYGYEDPAALAAIELGLESFQQGLLNELGDDPVGTADNLHSTRFTKNPGGNTWVVTRPEDAEGGAFSGQQTLPLGPEQTELLTSLNRRQTDFDLLSAQLASLRWELYAAYSKWVSFPRGTDPEAFDRVCAALCVLQGEVERTERCVSEIEEAVEADRAALFAALGTEFELKIVSLIPQTAPGDPVIMVGGLRRDSKLESPSTTEDSADGTLAVRFTGQTVDGLEIRFDIDGEDSPVRLDLGDLLAAVTLPAGNPDGYALPKEAADLWAEVCFLDLSCAPLLTQIYFQKRGVEPTPDQWRQVRLLIEKAQTAPFGDLAELGLDPRTVADAAGILGVPPARTAIEYRGTPEAVEQPWSPVYMDWRIRYFPSPGDFGDMLDTWRLGDVDYEWTGRSIPEEGIDFVGRTVLNTETAQSVTRQLETFVADDPNFANLPIFVRDALKQTATELADADIVAQSLAGLTDQLLSRATVMAYSLDALGDSRNLCDCATGDAGAGQPISAAAIEDLLGDDFRTTLQPIWSSPSGTVPFFPVRAGHFQIVDLWVVDAYGQILPGKDPRLGNNPIPDPFRSQSMVTRSTELTPEENGRFASYAQLPPRLSQSARVRLRLLDAEDDGSPSNASDRTSPICGWVIPNHLDNSLFVFDAAGENQGSIVNVQRDVTADNPSGAGIRWDAVPGSEQQLGAPPQLANRHLQTFVVNILELGLTHGGVLMELLGAIDASLWTVDPFATKQGNLRVLLGHPLAVVRADVALQLDGAPDYNQSADLTGEYFVGRDGETPIYDRRPSPFESIEFGLRIGDLSLRSNGTLGYFADDDYTHFFTAYGSRSGDTVGLMEALRDRRPVAPSLRSLAEAPSGSDSKESGYVVERHLLPLRPQSPAAPPTGAGTCDGIRRGYGTTKLTVLMDPFGDIPAITGGLPSVAEAIPRGPVSSALAKMKATFRVGPILTDVERIKMPLPAEVEGRWSWLARKDIVSFEDERPVTVDNRVNRLDPTPPLLTDGWLVLSGGEEPSDA
ncbi:MAG: hypothetical protein AAGN66_14860 [Acidobacteriota bacterium]